MHVLVVDDNRSAADALVMVLKRRGYTAESFYGGGEAIARLDPAAAGPPADVVVTDLRMAPVDGIAVLRHARSLSVPPEVLVLTGYGTVEGAVEAMRLGARDFLTKPVSPDQLIARLDALTAGEDDVAVAAGDSEAARALRAHIAAAASVRSTVLLVGEPGSGRRRVATQLHREGTDSTRALHILSHPSRADDFADTGTLFLPGVDHLDDAEQRQLLRLLDAASAQPDGPRVIAAVEPGWAVGSELYYRLSVLEIRVPALRERAADIPDLIEQLVEQRARALHREPCLPSELQLRRLCADRWPGNLRELAAVVERALVFGPGAWERSGGTAAQPPLQELSEGFSLARHLESVERDLLVRALEQTGGDRGEMSRVLGVERNALRYKLNKYKLLDPK